MSYVNVIYIFIFEKCMKYGKDDFDTLLFQNVDGNNLGFLGFKKWRPPEIEN